MEYVRKHRWASYSSSKCKEYLRNDFSYECAYCKLQEQQVGVVGFDFFEIDHFKPQCLGSTDMHQYNNLYYSCAKCNNEKSDTWDEKLLDPCVDDIFSGSNPAIVGGSKEHHYKYVAQNERGTFYINTFKLNSRAQIRFRKLRENRQNNIRIIDALINEILLKLQKNSELHDLTDLISQIEDLRDLKRKELNQLPRNEIFEEAEKYLKDRNIENSFVFEEYNMDIKIKIHDSTYYCELIVDNSENEKAEYRKNIRIEKLSIWFEKLKCNFGLLFYYPKINHMYFYPISDNMILSDIQDAKRSKQIRIGMNHLIA